MKRKRKSSNNVANKIEVEWENCHPMTKQNKDLMFFDEEKREEFCVYREDSPKLSFFFINWIIERFSMFTC